MKGAMEVASLLGVDDADFYRAISDFSGASKRLELVDESEDWAFYKDFAHAPSKLKATTSALKAQFPDRQLIACMELHTFSSLNKKFLPLYDGAMKDADRALVYFNPKVVEHKRLPPVSADEVKAAFNTENVEVYTDSAALISALKSISWHEKTLLMMSSGNFDGINFEKFGAEIRQSLT
jgi:UDP-N-acetylmuramate: L-alanyl-gamma-D-glutamyl-meso-diaminopimelate ligase